MYFPTAGIEVSPFLPFAAAFCISLCCSTAGISGAFLLLPFQISVLGYSAPGVSATNQLFNVIACPAGVFRFAKEGRMLLPLALFMAAGTLPGVFIGAILRLGFFSDAARFRIFAGLVLLYLALRMLRGEYKKRGAAPAKVGPCADVSFSWRGFSFTFQNERHEVSGAAIAILSLFVGLVGGVYGIGGGAIMSPFLVSFFNLPVYAIAGACLFATFLTSVAGVAFYRFLSLAFALPLAAPDWGLGILLGIGGMLGMYFGAALQKFIPARFIRLFLIALLLGLACRYLLA